MTRGQARVGGFSRAFADWIRGGGWEAGEDGDRLIVASNGGEIRYHVGSDNEHFVLTRADRAEDEEFVMAAADLVDIERYLTADIGSDLRQRRGYPWIRIPIEDGKAAPGLQIVRYDITTSGLRRATGEVLGIRWRDSIARPAVEFSYYADADPADMRRSFESPDGAPLFADFVIGP